MKKIIISIVAVLAIGVAAYADSSNSRSDLNYKQKSCDENSIDFHILFFLFDNKTGILDELLG